MGINSCTILAPAKINLSLKVLSQRSDGFHNIDAPTVPINLNDVVKVSLRSDQQIINNWQLQDGNKFELGIKAAKSLAAMVKPKFGVDIEVQKNIPIGAGLGGGSSNAAAVLLACNRLWKCNWSLENLANLGAKLGADIPFFIYSRQLRLTGIGEKLAPLAKKYTGYVVLCVAKSRTSTKDVYKQYNFLVNSKDKHKISASTTEFSNDLSQAAQALCPAISDVLQELQNHGLSANMSGSGSACFSVLAKRKIALQIASNIYSPSIDTWVAKILSGRQRSLGSSQAVRQRVLIPSCVGSNPTSPALKLN